MAESVRQRVSAKVDGGELRQALERAHWKRDEIEYTVNRMCWLLDDKRRRS